MKDGMQVKCKEEKTKKKKKGEKEKDLLSPKFSEKHKFNRSYLTTLKFTLLSQLTDDV